MKTFAGRKLCRTTSHRFSLLRHLTEDLYLNEKIQTTVPKAKELVRYAEKLLTKAKAGNLIARRQVAAVIREKSVQKKVFDVLVPRYQSRPGGYTQIFSAGRRMGDAAPMAVVRLVP